LRNADKPVANNKWLSNWEVERGCIEDQPLHPDQSDSLTSHPRAAAGPADTAAPRKEVGIHAYAMWIQKKVVLPGFTWFYPT
jgi:hypothetical protein